MKRLFKRKKYLGFLLLVCASLFSLYRPFSINAVASCSSSAAAQNNISVSPSHGTVFYIDTSVTPNLDAGYIGYRVTNNTGATKSTLWTKVSSFSGGKLDLAN